MYFILQSLKQKGNAPREKKLQCVFWLSNVGISFQVLFISSEAAVFPKRFSLIKLN